MAAAAAAAAGRAWLDLANLEATREPIAMAYSQAWALLPAAAAAAAPCRDEDEEEMVRSQTKPT